MPQNQFEEFSSATHGLLENGATENSFLRRLMTPHLSLRTTLKTLHNLLLHTSYRTTVSRKWVFTRKRSRPYLRKNVVNVNLNLVNFYSIKFYILLVKYCELNWIPLYLTRSCHHSLFRISYLKYWSPRVRTIDRAVENYIFFWGYWTSEKPHSRFLVFATWYDIWKIRPLINLEQTERTSPFELPLKEIPAMKNTSELTTTTSSVLPGLSSRSSRS